MLSFAAPLALFNLPFTSSLFGNPILQLLSNRLIRGFCVSRQHFRSIVVRAIVIPFPSSCHRAPFPDYDVAVPLFARFDWLPFLGMCSFIRQTPIGRSERREYAGRIDLKRCDMSGALKRLGIKA